jgi:hypothetical protein
LDSVFAWLLLVEDVLFEPVTTVGALTTSSLTPYVLDAVLPMFRATIVLRMRPLLLTSTTLLPLGRLLEALSSGAARLSASRLASSFEARLDGGAEALDGVLCLLLLSDEDDESSAELLLLFLLSAEIEVVRELLLLVVLGFGIFDVTLLVELSAAFEGADVASTADLETNLPPTRDID